MKIGTVTGAVWATRKAPCLQGQTFLVIKSEGEEIVAAYEKATAGDAEAAKTAQAKAQEFISLGQELDARLKTLQEAAKKGK